MSKDHLIKNNSRAASLSSDDETAIDDDTIHLDVKSPRSDSHDGLGHHRRVVVARTRRCCPCSGNYLIVQLTNSFFALCGLGMFLYSGYDLFIDHADRDSVDYARTGAGGLQLILGLSNVYNTEQVRRNNIIPITKGTTPERKTEARITDLHASFVNTFRKSSTSANFSKSDDEDENENSSRHEGSNLV